MKRNAMVRIIIWSVTLLLLSAILFGVLFGIRWNRTQRNVVTSHMETSPQPSVSSVLYYRIATKDVNVRSDPTEKSEAISMLTSGTEVAVVHEDAINGVQWSFINDPVSGWVVTEYLSEQFQREDTVPSETSVSFGHPDSSEKSTFDPSQIREIEIEWVAGNILILPSNTDIIEISESDVSDPKYTMVWKQQGNTLSIDFTEEDDYFLTFGTNTDLSKDLTIYVPRDWQCESLELDVASANVELQELTIREMEFDGASSTCEFVDCTVNRIDVDTASGDIRFTGALDILDCDAASASVYAVLTNTPSRLAMDTMSGDLDITLPQDAGFSLSMDTMSEAFSSEFEDVTVQNGRYIRGDGSCQIRISAMSGDVTIRKAPEA